MKRRREEKDQKLMEAYTMIRGKIQRRGLELPSHNDNEESDPELSDMENQNGDANAVEELEEDVESVGSGTGTNTLQGSIAEIIAKDIPGNESHQVEIHPQLVEVWNNWITKGLPDEQRSKLIAQYSPKHQTCKLEAPILNREVEAAINESAQKRDQKFCSVQETIGAALVALAGILTPWMEGNKPEDQSAVFARLWDIGKLLSGLHNSQSIARRAFISPNLNNNLKTVIQTAKIDRFLYGSTFTEEIKEQQSVGKIGIEIKVKLLAKGPTTSKNWKGPFGSRQVFYRRTTYNHAYQPRYNTPNNAHRENQRITTRLPRRSRSGDRNQRSRH